MFPTGATRATAVFAGRAAFAVLIGLFGIVGLPSAAAAQTEGNADGEETNQDVIVVATKSLPPFVFVDESGDVSGFSIDYWNEVAGRLNVETRWVVQETVGDILASAEAGEVDAAIAGISITREREAVIDFSQPYYISGQQIVTVPGAGGTFGTLFSLIGSGTFLVPLAVLVILVILVSHLVWLFERGHDSEDFPYSYRAGIGEALWWSTVSVITGGEAVKNINTALSRLIAVFWMLVGLFLLAFVTARATSVLTVAELESDISGIEDLGGRSVATVEGTASVGFLRDEAGIIARELPDLDTALAELASGNVDAVVFDAPVVAYTLNEQYGDDLILVEPIEGRDPYGIALPSGSERLEEVNAAVIEIGRDGTLDALMDRYFGS
ncbi:MAG: transporter substrate-binding domain-containing protein [Actinomycetota bacterium]